MPNWWEYESRTERRRRLSDEWRVKAQEAVFKALARRQIARAGYDPDTVPNLPIPITTDVSDVGPAIPPTRAEKKTGGNLFSRVKDVAGDVTETVFRGPIQQPWDILRPVAKAAEWEQRVVGRPLFENVAAAIGTLPLAAAGRLGAPGFEAAKDASLAEVFLKVRRQIREEELGPLKPVAEILYSPTTWIPGVGILKAKQVPGLLKATRVAAKIPVLSVLFRGAGSRKALTAAMAGGSEDFGGAADVVNHLKQTFFHVSDRDKIVREAIESRSLLSKARNHLGSRLAESHPELLNSLARRGMRLYDDDTAILLDYGLREIPNYAASASAALGEMAGPAIRKAFVGRRDKAGNFIVTNVSRMPGARVAAEAPLDYIAWNLAKYNPTKLQRATLEAVNQQLEVFRELRKAMGVVVREVKPPKGGYFFHRQVISRLEHIDDPVSLIGFEKRVSGGPPMARRLGAKQPFQKPRVVIDSVEGVKAGVHYDDFVPAQQLLAHQEILAVRDKWLLDGFKELGKTPTELIPEAIRAKFVTTAGKLGLYRKLERELSRNVRVPAYKGFQKSAVRGVAGEPDLAGIVAKAETYTELGQKAERKARMQELLDELRIGRKATAEMPGQPGLEAIRSQMRAARGKFRGEMEVVRAEGAPGFRRQFRGQRFPEYPGMQLERLERGQTLQGIDKQITGFNNLFRPVMATLDLSFLGIQGLLGLARHPLEYMNALKYSMFTREGSEALLMRAKESGLLGRFLEAGGHWFSREDFAEFALMGWAKKIPGARIANRAFSRFNNDLRLLVFEAGEKSGAVPAKDLARYVNLITGFTTSDPTTIEGVMFFAPRYFRSMLSLSADALTRGGPGGVRARQALLSLVATGSALTYTTNEALGEKTEFNPLSPNFMRIRALGQDISVFGPWDSLVRSLFVVARDGPAEGVKYFGRSKASPAMGRVYDLLAQETFKGEQLDWSNPVAMAASTARLLKQLGPIGIQQAIESGIPTTPEEAAAAAIQFAGMKATPLTPWEQVSIERDDAAKARFGKSWDELEPFQKLDLRESNPKLDHRSKQEAWAERADVRDAYTVQQEMLDKSLPPGKEWRDAYHDLRSKERGALEDWEERHPDEAKDMLRTDSDDPNYRALAEYYKAFDDSKTDYGLVDFEQLDTVMTQLEASWTPAQRAFVERNTGIYGTPKVKEYKADQKKLQPYWELRDRTWSKMQEAYPKLLPYRSPNEYMNIMAQQMQLSGQAPEIIQQRLASLPIIQYLERIVDTLRERYRRAHPDIDAILLKWDYVSVPIKQQKRAAR